MFPPAPTFAMTMFGIVWPAEKLRFDATGRATPFGYTVRYPAEVGPATVTLSTTAPTPLEGIPGRPVTVSSRGTFAANAPCPSKASSIVAPAGGGRVSMRRVGTSGSYAAAAGK